MEHNDLGQKPDTSSREKEKTDDSNPLNTTGSDRDVEARPTSSGTESTTDNIQAGVKNIEAVSLTWTKWGLLWAYASIFLMAFTTSLQSQTTTTLSTFATSSFNNYSLVSTVEVVQQILNAVVKTPMAKVADVFGRLEAFSFTILLFVIGYIQQATATNISTYVAAQIFYSAGSTGLQVLQQIFIADTSDLTYRALWSSLPDTPFLVTVWIGPLIGQAILNKTTWRWGYGIWCIILPVTFAPLASVLFLNSRRANKLGLTVQSPWRGLNVLQVFKSLWFELDIGGIILLAAAFALILIPLTIAQTVSGGWGSGKIIAMLVVGIFCLFAFPCWEAVEKLAPQPLIPLHLLKSRTFCAGCGLGFFYFMVFYLSVQPYFYSYLLVVQSETVAAAGHVTLVFDFSSTCAAVVVSFLIKFINRLKPWIIFGSLIYLLGIGLMIKYRNPTTSVGQLVGTQICVGIGGGMLNVPAQVAVQASTDHQHVAVATAVYLTSVQIGGAVGAAISGAIWSHNIPRKLAEYLPTRSQRQANAIFSNIDNALAYAVGTPERTAIDRAYQETMRLILIVAVCCAVPVIILSLLMDNYKLNETGNQVKGRVIGGTIDDNGTEVKQEPAGSSPGDTKKAWGKSLQALRWPKRGANIG